MPWVSGLGLGLVLGLWVNLHCLGLFVVVVCSSVVEFGDGCGDGPVY